MTMNNIRRAAVALTLAALAGSAAAHTGHGTHGFFAGLEHPFGLDHLLAMVAVGVWSAAALQGTRRVWGPVCFVSAMTLGAALGVAGIELPFVEHGISASVVIFGLMLMLATRLPPAVGLALIAASASLHGLAHGGEIPEGSSFAAYAAGFVLTTATLHLGGLGLGLRLNRARPMVWRVLGAVVGSAGLVMLARI
jgi:urease accessory protein